MVATSPGAADPDRGPGHLSKTSPAAECTLDLLGRARAGDRDALDALCRRFLPRLERWATGRLPRAARDLVDTGDIVQEALIRVVRHVEDFAPRHEGAFQAYLRKTLFNLIKDAGRRARTLPPRSELAADPADPSASPLEVAIGRDLAARYEAALDRLKPEDQEAIILRIELHMSYEEIATATAKPSPDAARMAVSRALLRLAEELGDER